MSNLYRGHAIDASYQVSVQLAKRFQGEDFKKNLVGSILGRSSIDFAHLFLIR
jgi:hypothetical protein